MQKSVDNHTQTQQYPSADVNDSVKGYRCEQISIIPSLGQVKVAEQVARLTPINMKVLTVLLDHACKVVSRAEIYDRVWANQIVSDDTLTRAISDIRALFKSLSVEHKIIETIPKKGYRWLLECTEENQSETNSGKQSANLLSETSKAIIKTLAQSNSNLVDQNNSLNNSRSMAVTISGWYRWVLWGVAGITLFSILAVSTIWLVNNQFSDRYIKIAMMPIEGETRASKEVVGMLLEKLQQSVLNTKDIRFLSSRMGYLQQHSLIPYLAEEFSVAWLIEVEISQNAGLVKITLNLVDAQSAVIEASVSQKIQSEQLDTDSLVERFVEQLIQISDL